MNTYDSIAVMLGVPAGVWSFVEFTFLLALAIATFFIVRRLYLAYVQEKFVNKVEWTTLNIRLPREVMRSPQAMELVFNAFHQGGGVGTWYRRLIKGSVLMWFSLEIVSIEGNIYFFIRAPKRFKDLLESQIYAQYPQAEISEVEDYVKDVPLYDPKGEWDLFGMEYVLTDPDPYPIKTYVDYGLDKSVGSKEEEKIDPLTLQLEYMGAIGPGEQIWTQIIIRKAAKRFRVPGSWKFWEKRDWVGEGKDLTKKLLKDFGADDGEKISLMSLTAGQKLTHEAVERSINKLGFDCGMRSMYLARKDVFDGTRIAGLVGLYRPFSSTYLNGFKLVGDSIPDFDYPWQDRSGKKKQQIKRNLQRAYIERGYFYPPFAGDILSRKSLFRKPFVLNTEELATLFHFPGKVLVAPGIKRVESRTVEPPTNLPS